MYVTILNRSEKEFWTSTLRKVISQINIHIDLNNKNYKSKNSSYDNNKVVIAHKEYEVLKVSK